MHIPKNLIVCKNIKHLFSYSSLAFAGVGIEQRIKAPRGEEARGGDTPLGGRRLLHSSLTCCFTVIIKSSFSVTGNNAMFTLVEFLLPCLI